MQIRICLCLALSVGIAAQGQMTVVNSPIPDNDANGLVSTLDVSTPVTTIQSLEVTLNIGSAPGDSAWNGDLSRLPNSRQWPFELDLPCCSTVQVFPHQMLRVMAIPALRLD